ncbi:monovalent cation/H+ antiporter subunit D [Dokdonella sp.]|uniref:monovalent cation/H+ antiporter subunit D n=1 Tax=Dokdonella sp. TaxID=2291710 RepID=UPI0031CB4E48|nr:monovalent cation/H+ antiporter subunit D [Dokdonella sp.]
MSAWEHLAILPILLPLAAGASMLPLGDSRRTLKIILNLLATLALLGSAWMLAGQAATGTVEVYRLGAWPAPFGIVLVVDRLSALMLLVTAVLALAALLFSLARWHRVGVHFHPLFQFLLMGLNGAFLTGDLFNLFVFFEVLLVASYGLALHGSGNRRVQAGLHYIAVNLAASLLLLLGVSLIYGVTGTLNMADLAPRLATLASTDRALFQSGAALLGTAFLVKAAAWPLGFWLEDTYAAAAAPVAAVFAIMSKVGVYAIARLWLLLAGNDFGADWLLAIGIATLFVGMLGVLAAQELARLAASCVLVSSGTLLAMIATGNAAVIGAALYYLVVSTLALGAFFLLVELAERGRSAAADILAVTREAYGEEDDDEDEEIGVAIPATMALLGLAFVGCALLLVGLPPLAGFIAKFALLDALFGALGTHAGVSPGLAWLLLALLLVSSLATLIALTRAGLHRFWAPLAPAVPRVRVIEMAPVALLLLACAALTVWAGPALRYLDATAAALHAPQTYIEAVLGTPAEATP